MTKPRESINEAVGLGRPGPVQGKLGEILSGF